MGFEIERKWLPPVETVKKLIADSNCSDIIQGYLCNEPVIRVRKEDALYYLTYKGKGKVEREEYNLPLNRAAFEELIPKCDGRVLSKKRYKVPFDGLLIEMDVFNDRYDGLCILEVEFPDRKSSDDFKAPEWFGTEVTGKKEYYNSYLASH